MNKNTWSKDYTGTAGLSTLAAQDAKRKGFKPRSKTKETLRKQAKKGE